MKKSYVVVGLLAAIAVALFLFNASFLAHPTGRLTILAHRGVHQRFPNENLTDETCTASTIYAPTHNYLEGTLPSMRAAFDAGADMVELDVHPTTDGEFVVFHDWGVDCRTNGKGVTRTLSLAYIKTLDVGYGYTADGGKTFPFRGRGVGMAPSLREVLSAFPTQALLVNFKSNDPGEGDGLVAYLDATPDARPERLAFYGKRPADRVHALRPKWRTAGLGQLKNCAVSYMLTGWLGRIGAPCRHTIVFLPTNFAPFAWGFPNRLLARLNSADSQIYLIEPIRQGARAGIGGLDDAKALELLPKNWRGGVSTDAVEIVGPLLKP